MRLYALPVDRRSVIVGRLVFLAALVVAAVGTRAFVGGWNDGSRLATVECLVDHHTLAIDHSIWVAGDVPDVLLTRDKLQINGHFYSDKSPVPAVLMAGLYQVWHSLTNLSARDWQPGFVYVLTFFSSGLAYGFAVWCVYRVAVELGLTVNDSLLLAASFALATVAPVYGRHANNHILLLAVATGVILCLVRLAPLHQGPRQPWALLLAAGSLAGLGYAIDLGAGPPLLACTLALVAFRARALRPVLLVGLAALPWVALNHALNFATGGTFKPANAVPEYLAWPGSPFDASNMTGMLNHASVGSFSLYALDLLVGQRGFLGHNPALFLAMAVLPLLLWRRLAERPELLFAACWAGGTWLLYSITSTNHGGLCCSVRWFVPLLAPGYLVLAIGLREYPRYRIDFLLLSAWGVLLAAHAWGRGPWRSVWLALYWPLLAGTLLSWLAYRIHCWRRQPVPASLPLAAPGTVPRRMAA